MRNGKKCMKFICMNNEQIINLFYRICNCDQVDAVCTFAKQKNVAVSITNTKRQFDFSYNNYVFHNSTEVTCIASSCKIQTAEYYVLA